MGDDGWIGGWVETLGFVSSLPRLTLSLIFAVNVVVGLCWGFIEWVAHSGHGAITACARTGGMRRVEEVYFVEE